MHTLEAEFRELNAAGVVDAAAASQLIALDRGTLFPVFGELRVALYAAVAAITTGVGMVLKQNLDRIGPLTLIIGLGIVAALCYAAAIRTQLRGETRSIGGDYVLLLGALVVSADLGYAESQFHWLGAHWSWHLLILALLHAATAYALGSRLVLSLALTSLAAWFGVDAGVATAFRDGSAFRHSGTEALLCSAVIVGWRAAHRRLGALPQFEEVFDHFAANLAFWGALALTFGADTRLAGLAVLLAVAAVAIQKGLRTRQQAFVVYGVGYAALGLCVVEAQLVNDGLLAAVLGFAIVTLAVVLLWRFYEQLKTDAP
jgi:hypothetical protein